MGYYSDLVLRPKEAIHFAFEHPSAVRAFGLVILTTLASIILSIALVGDISLPSAVLNLVGDVVRLLAGGLFLLIIGGLFKRMQVNAHTFVQSISMLAQLNVYGFFIFILVGFLFPVLLAPGLISSYQDYSQGVIGEEEFQFAVNEMLANLSDVTVIITLILFLVFIAVILYAVYALYLSISVYLKTTVIWTAVLMLVYAFIVSNISVIFSSAIPI